LNTLLAEDVTYDHVEIRKPNAWPLFEGWWNKGGLILLILIAARNSHVRPSHWTKIKVLKRLEGCSSFPWQWHGSRGRLIVLLQISRKVVIVHEVEVVLIFGCGNWLSALLSLSMASTRRQRPG
jgi:hypothetical protein